MIPVAPVSSDDIEEDYDLPVGQVYNLSYPTEIYTKLSEDFTLSQEFIYVRA